jgi:hypothetical protein
LTILKYIHTKKLVICFVCHVEISPNQGACSPTFGPIGKPLMSEGAMSWFHNVSTYSEKVIEY